MGILVKDSGPLTTIQDEGRFGYQQYGVTPSGPMDARAFHIANILVGNPQGEGAMELTFKGPELEFDQDNVIAITGADMQPSVNGTKIPMYTAVAVHAGDILRFGFAAAGGCRGYIAFAGGLDIPMVMGSKSTLASKKLGGYEGRALQKGDKIGFSSPKSMLDKMEKRKVPAPVYPTKEVTLRVVLGPQEDAFSEEEQRKFFWYSSTVTSEFDRQGCRLQREVPVKHLKDGNIISDGIAFGSIQVPTTGQPFIMMADRQTVGGYTKIGTVITVDLPKIAQAKPGTKIRFVQVSMDLAHLLYSRELEELKQLDEALNH